MRFSELAVLSALAVTRRVPVLLWALTLTTGCGGGDEPPASFEEACADVSGCETPEMEVGGPRERIWRVLAVRDGSGAVRIEAVQEVEVAAEVGRPQGPLGGEIALAALGAGGTPEEVQRLRFPDALHLERVDAFGAPIEEELAGGEVDAVGYLRASDTVETLALVDASGNVLASEPVPEDGSPAAGDVGASEGALVQPSASSACAHVMLIENNGDERWYPRALQPEHPLQAPTPTQRAVVSAALGRMTPMLCAGISRIAFVDLASSGTGGMVVGRYGDVVLLNATVEYEGTLLFSEAQLRSPIRRAYLMHTLFHEAAHTAEWLLNHSVGIAGFTGIWAPTERALARETIDNVRLRGGFGPRWQALHRSFEALDWAGPYLRPTGTETPSEEQKAALRDMSPAELAEYGMISHYATKQYNDDIADTVGWAMSAPALRAAGNPVGLPPRTNDFGCIAMREHDEASVPQSLAVVYTKLAFVRDLGLITPAVFESCAGTRIGIPVDQEGIGIYEDGSLQRRFTDAPEAVIGTLEDRYVFEMTVEGMAEFDETEYPATLRLELDLAPTTGANGAIPVERVSWPRGLYSLGPLEPNHFQLRMPDAPAGDFNVYDGFVLVAEASNDRIVGSVFVREALRVNAPVPVPQVFDPPLQFRFLMGS